MKILVVHNRYRSSAPGGEDRVVDQEEEVLREVGHEVRRLGRSNDDIGGFPIAQMALLPAGAAWNPVAARDLREAIGDFRPEVVHLHNLFPLLSPSVLRGCAQMGATCVVTLHNYQQMCAGGNLFRTGATCTDCVGRSVPVAGIRHGCYHGSSVASVPVTLSPFVHRRAWRSIPAAYIFTCQDQRREYERFGFPSDRCFVKANLVPPVATRVVPEPLVVFLGRLSELKGLRVLMRGWDRYLDTAPDAGLRLVIAGSGPLEAEIGAWASHRMSVEPVGMLSREECARLVRRAAAVVVPSECRETFGLVVAEAMAAGVAPIATSHGALAELIEDGVDGLLYPPGDEVALAALLGKIEHSPALVRDLGEAAQRTYERRFTPARVVADLEAIYRFAIANPRPGSVASSPRASEASGADRGAVGAVQAARTGSTS